MLNVRSHSSRLLVTVLPPPLIPALLNNKWILSVWWRSATSSRNRSTCVRSATSTMCVVTRSPCGNRAASHSLWVSARPVGETSHIATLQASATNWRTSSRPMPLPPPVTTAVLPANSVMCTSLSSSGAIEIRPFAYLSAGGEAQLGAMSGRQPPASLARELLEEIDIIGALGRPADQFIDLMGVWPDQNAPLVGLDSVEDDRRRFGGAGRRLLAEAALALGDPLPDLVVRHGRGVSAHRGDARPRQLRRVHRIRLIAALHLAGIERDRGPDMAGHDDRAFDVRRVDPQIGDQRLGETLYGKFRRGIGRLRQVRPDRGPKAVDAAGVDNVTLLGLQQQRQESARTVVDAAPADIEGPLPFLTAVDDQAAATADTGIVEQQMDPVGGLTVGDLGAEALHLREVGHVGDMRRDAQALRQPRRLAQPHGFRHPLCSEIAHRDIARLGDQLAHQLPPHPRTAAGDNRDPTRELLHVCSLPGYRARAVRTHSLRRGIRPRQPHDFALLPDVHGAARVALFV